VNEERVQKLNQVRILPRGLYYIVEIVYEKESKDYHLNKNRMIEIDLGLNNIVAVVNNVRLRPFMIKGGAIKSINQYYNKMRAEYQSLKEMQGFKSETKQLQGALLRGEIIKLSIYSIKFRGRLSITAKYIR